LARRPALFVTPKNLESAEGRERELAVDLQVVGSMLSHDRVALLIYFWQRVCVEERDVHAISSRNDSAVAHDGLFDLGELRIA
jgi:hypothetical protein